VLDRSLCALPVAVFIAYQLEVYFEEHRIRSYTELRDEKILYSYISAFGYRIQDVKQKEYYICRIYYTRPLKPRKPIGHYYYAGSSTSKAIHYLKTVYRITKAIDPIISIDEARNLTGSI
jgi:hypothetical protein